MLSPIIKSRSLTYYSVRPGWPVRSPARVYGPALTLDRVPEGTKRATSVPAEGPAYGLDFAKYYEFPLRALQAQKWHARPDLMRGWRNTVGHLIESVWLKQACHWPRLIYRYVREAQRGTLSSNSRFQAVLIQQYSANPSFERISQRIHTSVREVSWVESSFCCCAARQRPTERSVIFVDTSIILSPMLAEVRRQ